jgi:hypothetical protein
LQLFFVRIFGAVPSYKPPKPTLFAPLLLAASRPASPPAISQSAALRRSKAL